MNTFEMTYRTVDNMVDTVRFVSSSPLSKVGHYIADQLKEQGAVFLPQENFMNDAVILNFSNIQIKSMSLILVDDYVHSK